MFSDDSVVLLRHFENKRYVCSLDWRWETAFMLQMPQNVHGYGDKDREPKPRACREDGDAKRSKISARQKLGV